MGQSRPATGSSGRLMHLDPVEGFRVATATEQERYLLGASPHPLAMARRPEQEVPMADAGALPIDLHEKCRQLTDTWQPRVVAELNDYQLKVVRVRGDFVWHDHPDTDEAFLVLEGTLRIDLPEDSVRLDKGQLFVVPRGVRHKPFAEGDAWVLLIEPRGVQNTGSAGGDRTAPQDAWI